jgi:hypothetical protein
MEDVPPLPVRILDVREYIKDAQAKSLSSERQIPVNPDTRWFRRDSITKCVDRCRFELYKTAEKEGLHARYAMLQPDCFEACADHMKE